MSGQSVEASCLSSDNLRTVCSLALDSHTIWSDQFARHHPKTTKALCQNIALDISVVVLRRPHEPASRLEHLRYHIVNEPVLVIYSCLIEICLVMSAGQVGRGRWARTSGLGLESLEDHLLVVYLLEYIFKPPIVFLQDGVLGGQKLSETINFYHQRKTNAIATYQWHFLGQRHLK